MLGHPGARLRTLTVCSAGPGEGKTRTAIHLARIHAESGKQALLIEADLRRPSINNQIGLTAGRGLSEVLKEDLPWRESVVTTVIPGLAVLSAGMLSATSLCPLFERFH